MGNHRDKDWLIDQYIKQKKSMGQIAREFKSSTTTIGVWLRKHDIPRREAHGTVLRGISELNKDWLIEHYINRRKSTYVIGREIGVSWRTVSRHLDKFNIPKRTISENLRLDDDRLNKDWLTEKYVNQDKTMWDIAIELGAGSSTIERYLRKFDIPIKTPYSYGRNMISSPHKNILIPYLEKNGIEHITSYVLPKFEEQVSTAHPYEIDEFLPDHNIFLDLHGDYWHKLDKAIKSDRRKRALIKKHFPNIIYLVVWENEVTKGNIKKLDKAIDK